MASDHKMAPTPRAKIDEVLARLKKAAPEFAALAVSERIDLLEKIRDGYAVVLEDAVREGTALKGLDPVTGTGEEWLAHGMTVMRHIRLLLQSLEQIRDSGSPSVNPDWISQRPDGRVTVRAFPHTAMDSLLFGGIRAEIWMEKGVDRAEMFRRQARFYKSPHGGKVSLVLGAGNVAAIPPRDSLTRMFNDGQVVALKMNPVNEYLGPHLEKAFAPAIEKGYFAVVYGGGEEGAYLAGHPAVDDIHITGSDKTHDAIVWGPPGPEREERMRQNKPLLEKEITSELGNITPVIVVPGPWTAAELDFQARNVAGMIANNASFNCNAAKMLVTPKGWPQREALLAAIESALAKVGPRRAYYPGAGERFKALTDGRPGLRLIGSVQEGQLPWAIIPGVEAANAADKLFRNEPWCSILSESSLGSAEAPAFLEAAVKFANDQLWGTLCCSLLVHPATMKDPAGAAAVEKAIDQLRYGTVAVNAWAAVGFSLGTTPWGAHPSSSLKDIQSGRGWVFNTLMLDGIEKTVIRAEFKLSPKPVWFSDHKTTHLVGKRMATLEKHGSWLKLPSVAMAALRG